MLNFAKSGLHPKFNRFKPLPFHRIIRSFKTTPFIYKKKVEELDDSIIPMEPIKSSLGRDHHRTPTIAKIITTKSLLIPRIITDDKGILKELEAQGQKAGRMFGIFLIKEEYRNHEKITSIDQLEDIGTLAILFDNPEGPKSVYGIRKIRLVKPVKGDDLSAYIEEVKPTPIDPNDLGLKAQLLELYSMMRQYEKEAQARYTFKNVLDTFSPRDDDDVEVSIAMIERDPYVLYDIISTVDIYEKLHKCLNVVRRHLEGIRINNQIKKAVDEKAQQAQNNFILNETYKVIKKELGLEVDDRQALLTKFKLRMKGLELPEITKTTIQEEMSKLNTLEPTSAEFNVCRNYLDWLTILPWGKFKKEKFDIKSAQVMLDEDHYGLTKLKDRILEFIAVGKLKGTVQGKIILFVGPPGTGKTSIGKSIARSLDREFFRFSVGGMTDVAEIKGHRRTYIGAMPGKLLQLLKLSKSQNPVIMIDEIDKIGRGHGDPASALLELLDPEQNNAFLDHYLDVPFDMSKVLFICTANSLDSISKPLLDRMEVMRLSGYIQEEKLNIAKNYLIPTFTHTFNDYQNLSFDMSTGRIQFLD
jgi:Lon-like ATP-dependent protease